MHGMSHRTLHVTLHMRSTYQMLSQYGTVRDYMFTRYLNEQITAKPCSERDETTVEEWRGGVGW